MPDSRFIVREDILDEAYAGEVLELHRRKHSPDGIHLLIPQPNDDPRNPLNWSSRRKWMVLIAVSLASLLPDYGSATGAVTLITQGEYWNLSSNYVNHSQAGNVFMLGMGGVFACLASNTYGRQPVLFWMLILAVIFAILNAASPDFVTFEASRILQGFFSAPAQATGLLIIQDMYFFHEQVRKVNIWTAFFIFSPYVGPIISSAILSTSSTSLTLWRWSFGEYSILCFIAWLGICIFSDETWYNRSIPQENQPASIGTRMQRLTGIGRPKNSGTLYSLSESAMRLVTTLFKVPVFIVFIAFGCQFAWVVGINTSLTEFLVPVYGFGYASIALFYLTAIVATALGEIFGHYANQWIQEDYLRRNHGVWIPEVRLRIVAIAMPFMVSGLVLLGFALEREYHYMWVSFGWGLYDFSIMLSTTGYYQYLLDCYPEAAGEVSAWINTSRVTGGFIISYLIIDFVAAQGAINAFGVLAGISALSFILSVPVLMVWGPRLRNWNGPVGYAIPAITARFVDLKPEPGTGIGSGEEKETREEKENVV